MRREIIYHIDVPPNEMTKQEAIEQDRLYFPELSHA